MRVPSSFYGRIKSISKDQKRPMSSVLKDSERILENAQYLSNLIGRGFKKSKK